MQVRVVVHLHQQLSTSVQANVFDQYLRLQDSLHSSGIKLSRLLLSSVTSLGQHIVGLTSCGSVLWIKLEVRHCIQMAQLKIATRGQHTSKAGAALKQRAVASSHPLSNIHGLVTTTSAGLAKNSANANKQLCVSNTPPHTGAAAIGPPHALQHTGAAAAEEVTTNCNIHQQLENHSVHDQQQYFLLQFTATNRARVGGPREGLPPAEAAGVWPRPAPPGPPHAAH
jgi:hypothetical protein